MVDFAENAGSVSTPFLPELAEARQDFFRLLNFSRGCKLALGKRGPLFFIRPSKTRERKDMSRFAPGRHVQR
jgi:hypothetical protein